MINRTNKGLVAEWWWTVDRFSILLILVLMFTGIVLAFAASPAIATRYELEPYYFVTRQALYLIPAICLLIGASFLTPRYARRAALALFLGGLAMLIIVPFVGDEVKGARRWLSIAGQSIQPSEFIKPAFVILVAWFFADAAKRPGSFGNLIAIGLLGTLVLLLVAQPDIGQTMLISIVWCAIFFLAGMPWLWMLSLCGVGIFGLIAAYLTVSHVATRINGFLNPENSESYQIDKAIDSIVSGGWFGKGPGEGSVKKDIPDAHTDFIFAVAAEEYGVILCLLMVAVFAIIVVRSLMRAGQQSDLFERLAGSGLAILFGIQSCINLAVNLRLIPAKGMTLPFVSYGGSSILSLAIGMGLLLALTRQRSKPKRAVRQVTFQNIDLSVETAPLR